MLVYFVTDEPTKLPAIRAMLEPQHAVVPWVLGSDGTGLRSHGVLMIDIDLRQMSRVDQLKFIMHELADIHRVKANNRVSPLPIGMLHKIWSALYLLPPLLVIFLMDHEWVE